jgi:hypothetical protein
MCPVCWISGFIAALFGGSFIAVANHPISWILSIILISYPGYKFYEAKKRGKKMSEKPKDKIEKQYSDLFQVVIVGSIVTVIVFFSLT